MRTVQVVEAKAKFSALLDAVEKGEEIAITRHGQIVARLIPEKSPMAADIFRPFWDEPEVDLVAPEDMSPQPVSTLD